MNPYWIEDTKAVRKGQVTFLHEKEVRFWKDIIEKYLHPLIKKDGDQVSACCEYGQSKYVFLYLLD